MKPVTNEDIYKHCRECIENNYDHWCNKYNANPARSLEKCLKDNFIHKKLNIHKKLKETE